MSASFLRLLIPLVALAASVVPGAERSDEASVAQDRLMRIAANLKVIEETVERHELGRLLILSRQVKAVSDSIVAVGLANMQTIREYQVLVIRFQFSVAYLNSVATTATEGRINETLETVSVISRALGFESSPYSQISLGVFNQMKDSLVDLIKLPIPDQLKKPVQSLIPQLASLIAVAGQQGDRPRTFEAGTQFVLSIRALYPQFIEIGANNQAFENIMTIQGLAEFYAEFATMEK